MDVFEYSAKFGGEGEFSVEIAAHIERQLTQEDYETLTGAFQTIGALAFKYLDEEASDGS